MLDTATKTFTLEEYLALTADDFDDEKKYELEDGKLRELPPESRLNKKIALYLILEISKAIANTQIALEAEIVTGALKTRRPDLTVVTPEGAAELDSYGQSTIGLDMLPPMLVVEIVSPGKANSDRDYRYKRSEYAARGITYYWIVDPQEKKFTCLELVDGFYEEKAYPKSDQEISLTQPFELKLNLENIFDEA